ncbi:NPCBM/NEW2 domain-containing protein [Lentisphaerota bacterium WC36G]|nr:NPCBM/NEW2 domain-containing protein [Lentisphaerae bacterium WC36]
MSYNIGALPWPLFWGGTAGDPSGRVEEMGRHLNKFDIVGVQELWSYFSQFNRDLRFPYYSKGEHIYTTGNGLDFFSKFPMTKPRKLTFSNNEVYVNKGILHSKVMVYPEIYIDVINAHTGDSHENIEAQVDEISAYIQTKIPRGNAVIVMGDFNASMWDDFMQDLRDDNGLTDSRSEKWSEDDSYNGFGGVDRIFFRGGEKVYLTLEHFETIDNTPGDKDLYPLLFSRNGEQLSDHAPVVSILRYHIPEEYTIQGGQIVYLSDLKVKEAYNNSYDHGPIGIDQTVGGGGAYDGKTLRMDPRTYEKGLGVHAPSQMIFQINGDYDRFRADIGVDEESDVNGKVSFRVYGDNEIIYNSGPMEPWTPTKVIDVNVCGVRELRLRVRTEGSDRWDHADWANAHLVRSHEYEYAD